MKLLSWLLQCDFIVKSEFCISWSSLYSFSCFINLAIFLSCYLLYASRAIRSTTDDCFSVDLYTDFQCFERFISSISSSISLILLLSSSLSLLSASFFMNFEQSSEASFWERDLFKPLQLIFFRFCSTWSRICY